jgi:hypothetical protein
MKRHKWKQFRSAQTARPPPLKTSGIRPEEIWGVTALSGDQSSEKVRSLAAEEKRCE